MIHFYGFKMGHLRVRNFWRIIGAALLFLVGLSPIYVLAHPNRNYYLCVGGIPAGLDLEGHRNVALVGWVFTTQVIKIEF